MLFNIILYGYICPMLVANLMFHLHIHFDKNNSPRERIKEHIVGFLFCLIPVIIPIITVILSISELTKKFEEWVKADPAKHTSANIVWQELTEEQESGKMERVDKEPL